MGAGFIIAAGGVAPERKPFTMNQVNFFDLSRFTLPAVILVAATSITILASHRWRWCLFSLAFQYVGVFILTAINLTLALAMVKLVAGWMAGLVLLVAIRNSPDVWVEEERAQPAGAMLRLLAAGLVGMVVASVAPRVAEWMPGADIDQVWAGLILVGIGLLHLGLTAQPLRVVFGLLTILSGFEILYAMVETATLVSGLLATVNLGLALVGAYLLFSPSLEETR